MIKKSARNISALARRKNASHRYANRKGSDQPAFRAVLFIRASIIRAFAVIKYHVKTRKI